MSITHKFQMANFRRDKVFFSMVILGAATACIYNKNYVETFFITQSFLILWADEIFNGVKKLLAKNTETQIDEIVADSAEQNQISERDSDCESVSGSDSESLDSSQSSESASDRSSGTDSVDLADLENTDIVDVQDLTYNENVQDLTYNEHPETITDTDNFETSNTEPVAVIWDLANTQPNIQEKIKSHKAALDHLNVALVGKSVAQAKEYIHILNNSGQCNYPVYIKSGDPVNQTGWPIPLIIVDDLVTGVDFQKLEVDDFIPL